MATRKAKTPKADDTQVAPSAAKLRPVFTKEGQVCLLQKNRIPFERTPASIGLDNNELLTPDTPPSAILQARGYESLAQVLEKAFDQAARGKGAERHANDLPFDQQPMQSISELLDDPNGMAFQIMKKVKEALGMPTYEQQERELLGAINYTAGLIIFLGKPQRRARKTN
jgi:hypothetical protein